MEFSILGPLRVGPADRPLDIGGRLQRGLLAELLASPNDAVSDDRLIDELWGDEAPRSARHLLQVYASRLRKVLDTPGGGRRIVRQGPGYALRLEAGELDARRFLDGVAAGRDLCDREPGTAEHLLASALGLWHGKPFEDVTDAPPTIREQTAYLERQYREALQTRVELRLGLGHHRELIPELVSLVEAYPYDEILAGHLMVAMYRSGRQAEALEAGRAVRVRLRDDLGIDPSPTSRRLYQQILVQDPELGFEAAEPPSNLPRPLTSFIGRIAEVRGLQDLVRRFRLVTLTGPGGIGKTRLAIEVAFRQRLHFPDGLIWLDLATVSDASSVVARLAAVAGVAAGPAPDLDAVTGALGRRRALVLLDNCEHLRAAVAELAAGILEACPRACILATSRTPLHVAGERVRVVPPLGLGVLPTAGLPTTARSAGDTDAVGLFTDRARSARASFRLSPDNVGAVAEVCRRLDGIPLAIEMAAARVAVLEPRELARALDERFRVLAGSGLSRLSRYRTMEAAIDASYSALPSQEQEVFDRLSVFAGPFDLEAAAAVALPGRSAADAVVPIASLAEASMLTVEQAGERTRYRMLETLREFGRLRLRSRQRSGAARRAHAAYFIGLAERAAAFLAQPEFADLACRLWSDYDELRVALDWSLANAGAPEAARAAPALCELWYRRGDAREAAAWSSRILAGDVAAIPPRLLAAAHVAASFAADLAMDLASAAAHADAAVELAREDDDASGLVLGLWGAAHVALARGDLHSLREKALEALELCDRHGLPWARARPLSLLGYATLLGGSAEEAIERFDECLPLFRGLGDVGSMVIMGMVPRCEAALRAGHLDLAERFATEAVQASIGTAWEAAALVQDAIVLQARGDVAGAEVAARRGLRVALAAGLNQWVRVALRELARSAVRADRLVDAARLYGASRRGLPLPLLEPAVYGPIEARCRDGLGDERFERLVAAGASMTESELGDIAPFV